MQLGPKATPAPQATFAPHSTIPFPWHRPDDDLVAAASLQPGAAILDTCSLVGWGGALGLSVRWQPAQTKHIPRAAIGDPAIAALLAELCKDFDQSLSVPVGAHCNALRAPEQTAQRSAKSEQQTNSSAHSLHAPGWIVFASYDLAHALDDAFPLPQPDGPDFPLLHAARYSWALERTEQGWLLHSDPAAHPDPAALAAAIRATLEQTLAAQAATKPQLPALSPVRAITSPAAYRAAFNEVKRAITDGDYYQSNLTQRFISQTFPANRGAAGAYYEGALRALASAVFMNLRRLSPSPYAAFMDVGCSSQKCASPFFLISSSPECFYRVTQTAPHTPLLIQTRPIKGTRPGSLAAKTAAHELTTSEKERAELTMIVDLERNDLSRICTPGTVRVPEIHRVEHFTHVHHMVATVEGALSPHVTFHDILRTGFPGGSITGAPKIAAVRAMCAIEPHARGPYTGSLFVLPASPAGECLMDSSILIRTILLEPAALSFNTGGGIVADSECQAEYTECFDKARGMALALAPFCDVSAVLNPLSVDSIYIRKEPL
jgi:para-aminobenzoate synthetase component 1